MKRLPTQERGHTPDREFCFMQDVTGKEITSKLLARVREKNNVTIYEYTTMTDILEENGKCAGITVKTQSGEESCYLCRLYHSGKRRNRRAVPAFHKFSASDRRCTGSSEKTSHSSGESGLCTDPSDYIVFGKAGQTIPDLRIRPWGRCTSL